MGHGTKPVTSTFCFSVVLSVKMSDFECLYKMQMGPVLERTVGSFRLLPPTDSYVPPYKDPWRFW